MGTIKSFKKFIEESIWSDMQDRSAGVTKRKEDDVNLLDYDGLYDYIKSKYSGKVFCIEKDYFFQKSETICVDPIKNVSLYLKRLRDGSLEDILLSWVSVNINHPFLLKLEERFFVSHPGVQRRIIKEKDGTCTNQTYIDVIDFFLEYVDNIVVNESIWSDMQDRSAGDTVREEDMITTNEELQDKIYELYEKQGKGNVLDVSSLTNAIKCDDFSSLFQGYKNVKYIIGLENWDVSKVTNMKSMFENCENFNADLSKWDVSGVKNMGFMFFKCKSFNSDLSKWNVSSVEDMKFMFQNCEKFNSDLSKWNVSRVTNMDCMFKDCIHFNCDLSKWDVSNVEYMYSIFDGCDSLKNKPSWYMNGWCKITESIWSDMQDRSAGDVVRKEDEMNDDDFLMLRKVAKMFRHFIIRSGYTSWRNSCDSFIKYIEILKEEHFWTNISDEAYDKVIRFVQKNWGDCTDIQEFMDKYLSNINECDGVPGGLTPADVGGMGPAYFPGPNGEPGSGDLPSPTGIVYKQVAPFDSFIKIRKQKKKKKKFRKEDEPCVHSENPPIYSHVDDFRDYVDRTYDNIDKKK